MRSRTLLAAIVLVAALAGAAQAGGRDRLDALADDFYWAVQARGLRPSLSQRGNATWLARLDQFSRRLDRIQSSALGAEARTTRQVLRDAIDSERRYLTDGWIHEDLNALDSLLLTVPNAVDATEHRTVADWTWVISSLRQSRRFARDYTALLEHGLATGRIQPAAVVRSSIALCAMLGSQSGRRNPLLALESELERSLAGHRRLPELRRALRRALRDDALPAHRELARFLRTRYLPRAPAHMSAASYAHALERHLGPGQDPRRIARQGRREVDRLYREIDELARSIDPAMKSLPDFMNGLARRKSERFASGAELLAVTRAEVARADQIARDLLPVPDGTVDVVPMPKTDERTEDAQYIATGPTSGTFQINSTRKLNNVLRHELPSIVTHETFAGHHVQSLHAQKSELPDLRKNATLAIYDEGWAMYADHQRAASGGYTPLERLGHLKFALWAAAQMVVDVGLHTGTMTRAEATRFMARNMFTTPAGAASEVERMLNLPGHALSYYLGRSSLLRLRARTARRLGPRFDPRRFNEKLLSGGALRPDLLTRRLSRWSPRRPARRTTARPAARRPATPP